MKLLLVLLATAFAAPPKPEHEQHIHYEPIGYEQPGLDRFSYGYGNPEYVGYGGLIEQPVAYDIGRQGIGLDKRTAYAYGFRMPLTNDLLKIQRRYPVKYLEEPQHHSQKA